MPIPEGMNPVIEQTFVVDRDYYQQSYPRLQAKDGKSTTVRATVPELAGDPKVRYITNKLVDNTHLAGDPKRKGCRSLLGWGFINLSMEITDIINNKVG